VKKAKKAKKDGLGALLCYYAKSSEVNEVKKNNLGTLDLGQLLIFSFYASLQQKIRNILCC
jgi:hypothetical protein